jgi:hypothetical protein
MAETVFIGGIVAVLGMVLAVSCARKPIRRDEVLPPSRIPEPLGAISARKHSTLVSLTSFARTIAGGIFFLN